MKRVHFLAACVAGATALSASAESKPEQASADRVRVIAADELFDKNVVSSDGREIGEVEHVLIHKDTGKIGHVVIESEMEGSDDQLIAIPFQAIQSTMVEDEIELQTTMDKVNKAPRVTEEQISNLLQPTTIQQIERYWMPFAGETKTHEMHEGAEVTPEEQGRRGLKTTPEKGLETEAIGEDREQADLGEREQESMARDMTREEAPNEAIDEVPDEGMHGETPSHEGTPRDEITLGQQTPPEQPQVEGSTEEAEAPAGYVLLSRTSYRTLQPTVTTAEEIEDMNITSVDGRQVGEIEEVVIDIDEGRVAYTLVSRGGFLGLDSSYVAVPLQALEFTDQNTIQLKMRARQFTRVRGYRSDDVPTSVRRADLEQVYKQFKVEPYWKAAPKDEMATRTGAS